MLSVIRSIFIISFSFLTIGSVSANNFIYNSLDFKIGVEPASFGVNYHMQFLENAHFLARMDSKFKGDYDIAVGLGFNGPIDQFSDITGQILIHNAKSETSKLIGGEIVPEFNLGGRIWFLNQIELHGKVGKLVGDKMNNGVWEIGMRFHSTQQLAIGASLLNNGIYDDQFVIHTRFHF